MAHTHRFFEHAWAALGTATKTGIWERDAKLGDLKKGRL
ncbi:hypothetical protein QG37_01950 [Candidozyma auris]|uniref:Uncharacterized protein n=1 Tax=Candidozyma auris TaxID=498019 RepID=A0A0L0P3Y7_CANAR|nr:hypothetical protein QG37_01950 [[Candida] auris]